MSQTCKCCVPIAIELRDHDDALSYKSRLFQTSKMKGNYNDQHTERENRFLHGEFTRRANNESKNG